MYSVVMKKDKEVSKNMNRNRKIKRVKTKALAAIILAGLTAAGSVAA